MIFLNIIPKLILRVFKEVICNYYNSGNIHLSFINTFYFMDVRVGCMLA